MVGFSFHEGGQQEITNREENFGSGHPGQQCCECGIHTANCAAYRPCMPVHFLSASEV